MNKYLLLRDNKQTGPHSLDEIRAMGLKKYDLIWIEGRSAAWRYAAEIEEMRDFAPAVEEQPFDRFFRKPVKEVQHQEQAATTAPLVRKDNLPAASSGKLSQRKYVAVTLPGGSVAASGKNQPHLKSSNTPPQPEPVVVQPEPGLVASPPVTLANPVTSERLKQGRAQRGENNTMQYIALGVAIASIMMIMVLVFSNDYDAKTYPVSRTRAMEERQQTPVQDIVPIPASNKASEDADLAQEAIDLPGKTPVKRSVLRGSGLLPAKAAPEVTKPKSVAARPVEPEKEALHLADKVSVSLNDYRVNIFGGIDDIRVTVTNGSPYPLDVVVVELRYLQSNKKVFKTETLRFRNVGAGGSITLEAPKTSRGISLESKLSYITSKAAGVSENL